MCSPLKLICAPLFSVLDMQVPCSGAANAAQHGVAHAIRADVAGQGLRRAGLLMQTRDETYQVSKLPV